MHPAVTQSITQMSMSQMHFFCNWAHMAMGRQVERIETSPPRTELVTA